MAKETQSNGRGKYGANNASITMDGNDIVIRIDSAIVLHAAGTMNKQGKERKRDLVATTGGFAACGPCQVSLNVTG